MMLLSLALAVVAALCLLNLVLTLGVVRRLRDHSERLAGLRGDPYGGAPGVRGPGESVEEFTATSTIGEAVALRDLVEPTLVGFFAPSCPACEEQLSPFLAHAREFPGGRARVLTVIASESGGNTYRTTLSEVAAVVVERENGPLQRAFGARLYPSFLVVADGVVLRSSHTVADLSQHQPA